MRRTRGAALVLVLWLQPKFQGDTNLGFLLPSIVALVVLMAEGKPAAEVLTTDFEGAIDRLGLRQHLSSNRTQGLPNMIARVREAAGRRAA